MSAFQSLPQSFAQQKCFIGHTYAADWREVLEALCDELLPEYGLQPWYAYKYYAPTTTLREKVVEMIAHSRYGIYDLSYWRKDDNSPWEMPRNVLIELGIAIALNRPVLLLRHKENSIHRIDLPESLRSITQVCEFGGGESTLRTALLAQLPNWAARSPEQDGQNRYCLFGVLSCPHREAHPLLATAPEGKLSCHIADGPDPDQLDFRDALEKILGHFNNITFEYLDKRTTPKGYAFLLCAHCQLVRSTQFAIYRITPYTSASTFIAIGMSIALEYHFGYKIPKLMITKDKQLLPSLLAGYDCVVVNSTYKLKSCLAPFVQQVIEKINQTTYNPQPLPFESHLLPSGISSHEESSKNNEANGSMHPNQQNFLSPLVGLPGSLQVELAIQYKLNSVEPWSMLYLDLDNFKAFNDTYGFLRGNDMIRLLGQICQRAVRQYGNPDDFVGHIGGDDFIVITVPERVHVLCKYISARFKEESTIFYGPEDLRRGSMSGVDRKGRSYLFPLISLSIGVVNNQIWRPHSREEVSYLAAEAKYKAKQSTDKVYHLPP